MTDDTATRAADAHAAAYDLVNAWLGANDGWGDTQQFIRALAAALTARDARADGYKQDFVALYKYLNVLDTNDSSSADRFIARLDELLAANARAADAVAAERARFEEYLWALARLKWPFLGEETVTPIDGWNAYAMAVRAMLDMWKIPQPDAVRRVPR